VWVKTISRNTRARARENALSVRWLPAPRFCLGFWYDASSIVLFWYRGIQSFCVCTHLYPR